MNAMVTVLVWQGAKLVSTTSYEGCDGGVARALAERFAGLERQRVRRLLNAGDWRVAVVDDGPAPGWDHV